MIAENLSALLLIFFVLPLLSIHSLDFTASDPACDTMIPTFNHNIVNPIRSGEYSIRIFDENGLETFEYDSKKRRTLYVKIEGGPFERAHVQARSIAYPTSQVGYFIAPLPRYFKFVNCSGVYGAAVINDNFVSRRHPKLHWKPPNFSKGEIMFFASVIQSQRLFHIRSSFISPFTTSIKIDNHGCGRSYGCLKVGNEFCVFGETCRFSLKWRCYKQSMIVEATHCGKMAAFGFATSDNHAIMCISTKERVTTEDFFMVGSNGFPNVFDKSRSKGLKAIEDKKRFFCRFEMDRPTRNATDFVYGKIDAYGHPYKLKRWKLPGSDLCDAQSIHSTVIYRKQQVLLSSFVSGDVKYSFSNAHLVLVVLSFAAVQY